MLDFWTAMIAAPFVSLWFGFFIERSYRQGTTYNLIGYAARKGLSAERAECAVLKYFAKWDWLTLALALYCGMLALILYLHGMNKLMAAAVLAVGAVSVIKSLYDLFQHYLKAQRELS